MNATKREKNSTYLMLNFLAGLFSSRVETIEILGRLSVIVLVGGSPVPGNIVKMQSQSFHPRLEVFPRNSVCSRLRERDRKEEYARDTEKLLHVLAICTLAHGRRAIVIKILRNLACKKKKQFLEYRMSNLS